MQQKIHFFDQICHKFQFFSVFVVKSGSGTGSGHFFTSTSGDFLEALPLPLPLPIVFQKSLPLPLPGVEVEVGVEVLGTLPRNFEESPGFWRDPGILGNILASEASHI